MKATGLDHLVLTVKSVERSIQFYSDVLGMEAVTFDENRRALRFGDQKVNLHEAGKEFEPKAEQPLPGSADLCFLVEGKVLEHLQSLNVSVLVGPIVRTGARGRLESVYIRDPDGNLLELSKHLAV